MDGGAWQVTFHRVTKNHRRLKQLSRYASTKIILDKLGGPNFNS